MSVPSLLTVEEDLLVRDTDAVLEAACRRIPPLWPLQSFVAVNPFVGLSETPFSKAADLMGRVGHAPILMDAGYYSERIRSGEIAAGHIRDAMHRCGFHQKVADPASWLLAQLDQTESAEQFLTVADWLDQQQAGSMWAGFVVDEISKWCSSYFDRGQSPMQMPWRTLPLYQAWKRAASLDANPEVFGLPGFRSFVQQLPDSHDAAIQSVLASLGVPAHLAADFLHRELISVFGWAAYAAWHDRQNSGDFVRQLLAVRLAYDAALLSLDRAGAWQPTRTATQEGPVEARVIAQTAAELAFRSRIARKLAPSPAKDLRFTRPALQAIFCIDVRSEVYRRALEAQSFSIETIGFAGFFGVAVEVDSTARCPVLISPRHKVEEGSRPASIFRPAATAWKQLFRSATACFSSVEAGGMLSGLQMLRQLTKKSRPVDPAAELSWNIPLDEQVDLAAGALKNMSLDPSRLAPVVLVCGHGSSTENNPYAASLDCGACGGHKGDVNARLAAALLNDAAVREGLQRRSIQVPHDTVFVAGLHVTTTDEVILYDAEKLLSADQHGELTGWLQAASKQARAYRSQSTAPSESLDREFHQRSADWSEVRPEWGLAGNAAFIAAPRSRTKGLDLEGRVFLHEYDASRDADSSVLQLILTAPVVVASWINLQYYGSTVNNRLFGSGNKTLHNVVGTFGIWEGNGGDLRTGLPLQSLHDGARWVHEPLRLQVFIESPRHRMDAVLRANADVRNLVENGWIHLMAIEDDAIYECRRCGEWAVA
jgi:uncharacterized protein YbcC (UPF0753/DUF2309 family)